MKESSTNRDFFKALAGATVGRGKDKDKNRATAPAPGVTKHPDSNSYPSHISRLLTQSTNISLVERFTSAPRQMKPTFLPRLPSPPPLLPPEIQYWTGVIMPQGRESWRHPAVREHALR